MSVHDRPDWVLRAVVAMWLVIMTYWVALAASIWKSVPR